MSSLKSPNKLNLFTDFSYLNTPFHEKFLNQKVHYATYADNTVIQSGSSTDAEQLSIIYSGNIRILRTWFGKNMITSYDLGVGDIFGIESILPFEKIDYISTITSIGETVICHIDKNDLAEHLNDINVIKGLFNHYVKTMNHIITP